MSRERIIGCWRLAITAVMVLLLADGSERGSVLGIILYGSFALVTLVIPDWVWAPRPVRLSLHGCEVVVVIAALLLGVPLPTHVFMIHLVVAGGLLLGPFGASGTAVVFLLWQIIAGSPDLPYSLSAMTLSVLLVGGILVSMLVIRTGQQDTSITAIAAERERIARNLHDGPLQSVIGAKLQLYARGAVSGSAEIAESLEAIGREISSLIRDLRPRGSAVPESRLTTRLNLLAAEVKRQWNVELELGEIPLIRTLDPSCQRDLRRLIREAVVNAARHSGSRRIEVHGEVAGDQLNLVVRDHGSGFPFRGRLSLGELRASGWGPRSLCERLELIGGDLMVDSTPAGSTVVMTVPVRRMEA